MNYKKLIAKRVSALSENSSDRTGAVVALLTGLAVGAVLGVLFAPDSGKKTRERISDKALDLADSAKDNYHSLKDKINYGKDSLLNLKERAVETVKHRVDKTTQEFREFRDAEIAKKTSTPEES